MQVCLSACVSVCVSFRVVNPTSCSDRLLSLPFGSYLRSIGEIIFLNRGQGLDERVIIDPQWFCGTVIGRLSEPTEWVSRELRASNGGTISRAALLRKLELDKISGEGAEMALAALEQLLLCDRVSEPPDHYIVPVLLQDGVSGSRLLEMWGDSRDYGVVCGRRFECASDIDALGAGFFPKLQIALGKVQACESVELGQGSMCLVVSGCAMVILLAKDQQSELGKCLCVCVCVCVCASVYANRLIPCRLRGASTVAQVRGARGGGAAAGTGCGDSNQAGIVPERGSAVPCAQRAADPQQRRECARLARGRDLAARHRQL
jgi:hypothetical protein